MAEEMTKEEKARIKEERRKAFLAAHPELAAKQAEAENKKAKVKQKAEQVISTVSEIAENDQMQARIDKMNALR